MITPEMLEGPQKVTWCTGCGNFGILAALNKAVIELNESLHNLVISSGIGCSGKLPHYIGGINSYHTLHGRPIPVATGIHLANTDLKVIVHTGDGDCLGEGLGHFVHAARRNVNLAVFIHNNGVNGLTKGQFSPAAPRGYVSNTSPPPPGSPMEPVNPTAHAIIAGATFVARGFSGDQNGLIELMVNAIRHRGFAVVDILQPCVTWNRQLTWKFYNEHTYSLQDNGHDETDKTQALQKALENGERYPVGVFYNVEAPDLALGLALPEKGALKDHTTDLKDVQKIIDDLML
ncbi:2-oxoacid ferredoxin oxidoreductase [Candidatus Thorarchaeota archaeon]|nr:MAG: 2-oxoacid ferredoxin oxidoreductase [Candidatus Thorarchaeota archaeon]